MTTLTSSRRGHGYTAVLVGLCCLLLASLGGTAGSALSDTTSNSALSSSTVQAPPAASSLGGTTPAVLHVSPVDHAVRVRPDARVTVRASSGTLGTVTLADASGDRVAGQAGPGATWKATQLLHPGTAYTLTVAAIGPGGAATTTRSRFTTLKPRISATYTLIPAGGVVGVGMPVIVQFDSAISSKAQRAEVEKRVKVTSVPDQAGAWGWLDDRQLMWRPRSFWKSGTKVTVSAPLRGVQTGPGKWIVDDRRTSFTVGSSMVSSVNMKTHTFTVRQNGRVIRTIPVSTGKPGPLTETRSGTKVIIERDSAITMDSATVGIPKGSPGYYKIDTKWNLRLTWTGEFIHSAPWSVGAQGTVNVSHGCTNMSPTNAEWMFRNSKMGDVVRFTGSTREFKPTEGIGVWVFTYAGWKAQSALA